MRDPVSIRTVPSDAVPRAVSVQVTAFSADPIMRWLWPEPHAFVTHFPTFVRAFGGGAFDHGAAHVSADFSGGTLWLPPDVSPDEAALEALLTATVPEPTRSELLSILERLGEKHPTEPHWHLAFIGVDPAHQQRGVGNALLSHTLARVDREHQWAYLESSNPRNVPLYQRHGFEVLGEIRVGNSPPAIPMTRKPR